MNFFYEPFPQKIIINKREIAILTDFREYIRLLDMLKDNRLTKVEKFNILQEYFLDQVEMGEEAIESLAEFIVMEQCRMWKPISNKNVKNLFSYEIDYPCILSGFLQDYKIDLEKIPYLHWWKFRMLFDNLSEKTEIKQRILYRGIDLRTIKDKNERKRISKIQIAIQLPNEQLTDFDIGNAFA